MEIDLRDEEIGMTEEGGGLSHGDARRREGRRRLLCGAEQQCGGVSEPLYGFDQFQRAEGIS